MFKKTRVLKNAFPGVPRGSPGYPGALGPKNVIKTEGKSPKSPKYKEKCNFGAPAGVAVRRPFKRTLVAAVSRETDAGWAVLARVRWA